MPDSLSPRTLVALTLAFIAAVFIFAGVYTATQHKPTPHSLRVGAVGQDTYLKLKAILGMPPYNSSSFNLIQYESRDDLVAAINNRKVYAGFVLEGDSGELVIASAAGKVLSDQLQLMAINLMQQANISATVTDVTPVGKDDVSGLSSYTYQYGLLVPAFVFAVLMFMFAHGLSMTRRLGLVALYSVGGGILGALTVDQIVGALPGHFLALAGLGILYSAMTVLVAYGLSSMFGYGGAALAGLLLILIGNSTGGGSMNQEFLPDGFRTFGQVLPNGAYIRSVRNTVYFHAHHIGQSTIVVALWAIGGLVLLLAAEPVRTCVFRSSRSKTTLESAS
jgi:ABC-type sugar transport system permease subunit